MKNLLILLLFISLSFSAVSQAKTRTLPGNINLIGYDCYYPAISGDGNSIVYLSNYSDSGDPTMLYSYKLDVTEWKDPVEMPVSINVNYLNYEGGYSLNFDGTELFFTSKKGGGLGGYDLWTSKLGGGKWQGATNLGNGVNTSSNEGMPSTSFDGQQLYFCRCETMTETKANGCEMYVATLKGSSWKDPKPLPSNINSFNPKTPRIMADGETLIFTSDRGGSNDLYLTRKLEGDSWEDPKPMSFVNTTADEQFVSVAVKGRYLYHDIHTDRGKKIEMLLIPEEYKANNVMHVKGRVVDAKSKQNIASTIKVYNVDTRERIIMAKISENKQFNFPLPEGNTYDFSIEAVENGYEYFSKLYDLREMDKSPRDEMEVELELMQPGTTIELGAIAFSPHTSDLEERSTYEFRRLTRMMRALQGKPLELTVHRYNYTEDSLQNNEDLTEVITDTLWIEQPEIEELEMVSDSVSRNEMSLDSLRTVSAPIDSVSTELVAPQYKLKYTYHNDRTMKQAWAILHKLTESGVNTESINIVTSKTEEEPPRGVSEIVVTLKLL